jgi:outer membrane protein assembly factor BamB
MNSNIMSFLSILVSVLMFSCCESVVPVPDPPDPTPIDTTYQEKYRVYLGDSLVDYLSSSAKLYKDLIILPVWEYAENKKNTIFAYNKYSGKLVWKKDLSSYGWRFFADYNIVDNMLVGSTNNQIYGFNLETKEVEWFHQGSFDPDVTLIGNHVYVTSGVGASAPFYTQTFLTRFNVFTGSKEDVLSDPKIKGVNFYSPPALYMDPASNDSILLYKRTILHLVDAYTPVDVVAYNLSKRKIMWEKISFSPCWSSKDAAVSVHGDDVIVQSDWHLYKYDIMTGDELWKYQIEARTTPINGVVGINDPVLYGDKYIVQQTLDPMHCIDAHTGKRIWYNAKGSPSASETSIVHKDMIINTSGDGKLRAYDLNTGLTFLSKSGFRDDNVVYDAETDMYFTVDFRRLYAFKINKPK